MTVVLRSRMDIGLEAFERVAWQGEPVEIAPEARERIQWARDEFLALVDSDEDAVIYGVTTGAGDRASMKLSKEERDEQARQRPRMTVSFGEPFPERVVRGIVLARLANYIDGNAGVRPELAEAVAELLDGRKLPEVSLDGNGGAGEIIPLFTIVRELELETALKEPMALINGSPVAAALIADAAVAARRRIELVYDALCLSAEAIMAPLEAYSEPLEALWGDPGERAALQAIRGRLEGGHPERRSYQAPVSYRIMPRVLGQAERAVARAEEAARTSLVSVTDNPVYVPPDELGDPARPHGTVFSTGGYHNGMAYPALDGLAHAWADLAQLCERQTERLVEHGGKLTDGAQGLGFPGIFFMVQVAWAEDARHAAEPTFLPLGGLGQNDTAVPTALAWRKERDAARALSGALATLVPLAIEALRLQGVDAPPALRDFHAEVRRHFPPPEARGGTLGEHAGALLQAFQERVYAARVPVA